MGFLKALLLIAGLAYGQQQRPLIGAPYRDFSSGLVDTIDPSNLQPNQSPALQNVVIDDPDGSIKPRNGFTQCGGILPSGSVGTALYQYSKADGTRRLIISDNNTVWETSNCISFSTVATGLGVVPSYFATVRNKLWIVNGSTHPYTWDGTTAVILDGRANTPNPLVPKCTYIEFWKERVWCARTTSEPSEIRFSALTDSGGNDLDPSTGTLSWPVENGINIDQDGGSAIYGIKAYRDRLYVFKNNGIWQVIFNSDFDITVSKTLSSVGSRFQNSIIELDGLLYFVGPDGIYMFDGEQSVRISALIENKFRTMNQPLVNNEFKLWTSADDFAAGTLVNISTTYYNGSVVPEMQTFDDFNDGDYTNDPTWTVDSGSDWSVTGSSLSYASTANSGISSTGTMPSGIYAVKMRLGRASNDNVELHFISNAARTTDNTAGYSLSYCTNVSGLCATGTGTMLSKLTGAGHVILASENVAPDTNEHDFRIHRTAAGNFTVFRDNEELFSATDATTNSSIALGLAATGGGTSPRHFFDNVRLGISSYALITSDIYNAVSVSSWSVFDADYTSNSGNIQFQVKVGSSTDAIAATAWSDINSGSLIQGGTWQTYVQWRAIITVSTDSASFPQVHSVATNYSSGGSSTQQLYAQKYKNRYWISSSTGSSTENNMVLVKSRAPKSSWVVHDLKIGPMSPFGDNFYALSSTHSAIYRLDFGTNDGGSAISWFWESREETYERPNIRKYLMELTLDYRKGTETALTAGYSRDGGASYTTKSVSAAGSGRGTSRLFMAGSNSTGYRFKVSGSTLDGTATVLGITGWARPAEIRE